MLRCIAFASKFTFPVECIISNVARHRDEAYGDSVGVISLFMFVSKVSFDIRFFGVSCDLCSLCECRVVLPHPLVILKNSNFILAR